MREAHCTWVAACLRPAERGPAGLAAQNHGQPVGQEDNTAYGTTSAEFLLLGAGARGTALGGSFAAIATDVSALYYNPAGVALLERPGSWSARTTTSPTPDTRGAASHSRCRAAAATIGFQLGTFGFKDQPVYTEEQPDGTGAHLLGQPDLRRRDLRPELLRPVLGRHHREVRRRPAGHGQRQRVRGGLRHQLPRLAEQPSGQVLVRARQPGLEPELLRHRPRRATCRGPRSPARTRRPTLPQQANLLTKDFPLPTTFRVGLAYDVITGDNNRLTVLGDFNQPNNNKPGLRGRQRVEVQQDRRVQLRLRRARAATATPGPTASTRQSSTTALERRGEAAGPRVRRRPACTAESNGFALGLDYAYKYLGVLGPTNFFSFTLGW